MKTVHLGMLALRLAACGISQITSAARKGIPASDREKLIGAWHHVQGSNTRDLLVGKDLPRAYRFDNNGRLMIRSTRADEHWSAVWEHH